MDPQTLRVMWKPPPKEMWNGAIRGYYVGFRISGTEDPFNVQTVEVPDEYMEEMKLRIPDLQKYTQYGVMVQAFNDKGLGPKSEEIVVMTSEDVPSRPPQNVRCSVTSSSILHVTWQPPPADALNGILRGYKIGYKNMEEWSGSKIGFTQTTATYKTLENLEKNANYSVQIMGYTNMGEGVKSEAVYCKTKEDVPAPPAEIKVLPLSTETVLVVWKPPSRPNGYIIKYNVYARELEDENKLRSETHSSRDAMQRTSQHNFPTKHSVRGDAVQYEVKGLKANQRYEFWVTATTAVGEGKSTAIIAEALMGTICESLD
uniref:Fibronectin type-III domain-containing protein n=1 Tax=Strigamia maritima TaxID=126957 RepID=T1JP45_STRMM